MALNKIYQKWFWWKLKNMAFIALWNLYLDPFAGVLTNYTLFRPFCKCQIVALFYKVGKILMGHAKHSFYGQIYVESKF